MHDYKCDYSVNGVRTKEVVTAFNAIEAQKLIEARYPNAKITWWILPTQVN